MIDGLKLDRAMYRIAREEILHILVHFGALYSPRVKSTMDTIVPFKSDKGNVEHSIEDLIARRLDMEWNRIERIARLRLENMEIEL